MTNPTSDNYTVENINVGEIINRVNAAVDPTGMDGNAEFTMPLDGLPKEFVEFVREVAEVRQYPVEHVALMALTGAGGTVGGKLTCRIGGHLNPASLQTIINAPSGAGKSAPMKDIMQPIIEIDKELIRQYKDAVILWKMTPNGKPPVTPRPPKTQLTCGASSDAALMDFLCANPRGGILYEDELSAMFARFGTKHNEKAEARMLSVCDSTSIKDDTKTNDDIMLCPRPFLSILGGIQPVILKDCIKHKFLHSGLFGRFIVLTFKPRIPNSSTRDIDPKWRTYWSAIVQRLFDMGKTAHEYSISPEAQAAYDNHVQSLVGAYTYDESMDESYNQFKMGLTGKTRIHVTRMAILSMLLRQAHDPYHSLQHDAFRIEQQDVDWAFSCVPYLNREKVEVYEFIRGIKREKPTAKKPITAPDMCRMLAEFCQRQGLQHSQNEIATFLGVDRGNFSKYVKQ